MRAAEWAAWTRTLPWRGAVILGVGAAGGGVLGRLLVPRLGLVVGMLAAVAAGWELRFRPSPDARVWRRGAAGERRTARLLGPLERQGWVVLHDLAVPGSRANLDHLVIGPGGVFVIDSKQYRGRLQLDPSGRLWHGRYPSPPHCGRCRSRPTRPPRSCPTRAWRWCRSWLSTVPRSPGQGPHGRSTGRVGPASAGHASPAPGGAGARAGHRSGRPGPGLFPSRRLTVRPALVVPGVTIDLPLLGAHFRFTFGLTE
jgi:hypothetical protein